jgi:hypothetical protein
VEAEALEGEGDLHIPVTGVDEAHRKGAGNRDYGMPGLVIIPFEVGRRGLLHGVYPFW